MDRYRTLGDRVMEKGGEGAGDVEKIRQLEQELEIDYLNEDIPGTAPGTVSGGTRRVGRIVADLKNFAHPGNDRKMLVDINQGLESTLNVVAR